MSFGGSSGQSSGSSGPAFAGKRGREAGLLEGGLNPVLSTFLQQIFEGLRTGGVGASIPIIQQAVSQSRGATSQALQANEADATRGGFANNPAFQGIQGALRMFGNQRTASIPTDYVMQLINFFPQLFGEGIGAVTGLLGGSRSQNQASNSGFNFSL